MRTGRRRRRERVPREHLARRRSTARAAAPLHDRRAEGRRAALVARRLPDGVRLEPGGEGAGAALRHPARGRRGAEADEAQGGRQARRVVAGRCRDRVRVPRPRRVVRRGGRPQAPPAADHAALLQARQRGLDVRSPQHSSSSSPPTAARSRGSSRRATTTARSPAWSPDGSTIAFSSARGENWDTELVSDIYLCRRTAARHAG